jgi:murein DD-endopeptidase MepM/ murein hydrolase activator NlpD
MKQIIFLIIIFLAVEISSANLIDNEKDKWKEFFIDGSPKELAQKWILPFKTKNRTDIRTIGIVSSFGAFRVTYLYGHKHTGLDCILRHNDSGFTYIYPMSVGIVCSIHNKPPRLTVVIKHLLPDSTVIFTSYVHFEEIYVKTGEQVTSDTKLGRIYTKAESKKFHGNYYHLHLEVRKKFDDYGCASWLSMTKEEISDRYIDPMIFIRKNIIYNKNN